MMKLGSRRTGVALVTLTCLLITACGSQLTDDEILARSGVEAAEQGSSATNGSSGGGQQTAERPATAGDASPTAGPAATAPGDSIPGTTGDPARPKAGAPEAAACTTNDSGPIVVGNVGDYSGPAGTSLAATPAGVQVWAAYVNSLGGICGRQVQVIVQDAGGDPARNASLTRNLVESQGAVAFVANANVLSGRGGLGYVTDHRIPLVGDGGFFPETFESPLFMPLSAERDEVAVPILRSVIQAAGRNRFGLLTCAEAEACHDSKKWIRDGAAEAGADLVWTAEASVTQIDFTAECQDAQRAGVELMLPATDAASVTRFVRSCARQGYFPQWVLGAAVATPEMMSERGLERAYLFSNVFPFEGASTPAIDEFHRALEQFAPRRASGGLAYGWTAGKLFELAATRAARDTNTINSETIVAAMATITNETLGGLAVPLTMTPSGVENEACSFLSQGDGNGGYTTPLGPDAFC